MNEIVTKVDTVAWRSSNGLKILVVMLFMLVLNPLVRAQGKQISGVIKSAESDEGLPGVTVLIKGTTTGAVTDIDGNFRLNASPNDILSISYVGFKNQEILVGNQTTFDIILETDLETLAEVEVVATGYGGIKKADMTSAHVSVSSKDLEKTVNTTFEQALQGRASGVMVTQNTGQPGGGISVRVRGVSTITGNAEPLYVIDGVQIQGSEVEFGAASSSNPLAGLNPADIASVDVLQGPSATSLYGSRGTNGVVVITTKRGRAGGVTLSYGYNYSLQTPPESLDVMNLQEYAVMTRDIRTITGGNIPANLQDPSLLGTGTDWQEELFTNAPMHNHQLSASGGNEVSRYYFSVEHTDQDGIAIGSGFRRYSARLNMDSKFNERIDLNTSIAYNQTKEQLTTSQEGTIRDALRLPPTIPVRNFDNSFGGPATLDDGNQFQPANPVGIASITTNEQSSRQILGSLRLGIKIIEGLRAQIAFNGNTRIREGVYFQPTFDFGAQSRSVSFLSETVNRNWNYNFNQRINYYKKIGKHSLNVMVSHETQEGQWDNLGATRGGFLEENTIDINLGDAETATNSGGKGDWALASYLGQLTYNFADRYIVMGTLRADGSANFGPDSRWGYFPSVSVAWKVTEEPFFNVAGINDLKLRFEAGTTGNQGPGNGIFAPLNAAQTEWGTGFLPTRIANPALQWEETSTLNLGLNLALFNNRIALEFDIYRKNTDNLLMEASLPDYFGVTGEGSLAPPFINAGELETNGWQFTLNTVNIEKGDFVWESSLNVSQYKSVIEALNVPGATFDRTSWWMDNWTQRSIVGSEPWMFYGYIEDGLFQTIEEVESSPRPVDGTGTPLPVAEQGGVWIGDAKFRDVSGPEGVPDGIIDDNDLTFIGNPWPDMFGGFTNSFRYKGLELTVLLTGVYGNDIYNFTARDNTTLNNLNVGRNFLDEAATFARIDNSGDEPVLVNPGTRIPRVTTGDPNGNFTRHTSKWVEDGSFIRLKNVSLRYNIPNSLLSKLQVIKNASVVVSAQNVYTWTNYSGYDPEIGSDVGQNVGANNQAIGVDNGRYPLTPVYSMGIRVEF